jgi:branched-chain amino acid transport system substrate-binding protein
MHVDRRTLVKGLGAGLGAAALPMSLGRAQAAGPIRIGFLTVKTGPLASGGIAMEQGLTLYLKERGNRLVGRDVEVFTADTGGVPANARTKTQELVEKNHVHCLIGPLAAFEALAVDDFIRQTQTPTLSVAAAEDMTQRNPNPWFVRATASSAQASYPLGDYAAKELKYKRIAMLADDIAYGHELNAGFQRAFEDAGGKIVQKLWPPLTVPDYGTYIAQIKPDVDAVFLGFAGSNGFRFVRQFAEYGLRGKIPLLGGMTAIDESILQQMGDDAQGIISTCWYSAELDNAVNKKFVEEMRQTFKVDPGFYAAATYVNGAVLEAAVTAVKGNIEDKPAFMKALRTNDVAETARGPVRFDKFGNVIGNVYLRRVEKKDGRLVNTVFKTYPDVSQFWTYDTDEFLKNPVYSRDYPPARFLEQ